MPALEAMRTPPRRVLLRADMERQSRVWSRRLLLTGLVLMPGAWVMTRWEQSSLVMGFAAMFLFLIGYACISPALIVRLCRYLQPLAAASGRFVVTMAVRNIAASLSRTGIAMITLMIAMATAIGVAVMISSFRLAVDDWLSHTLRADIYASLPEDRPAGAAPRIAADTIGAIRQLPGVEAISLGQRFTIGTDSGPVNVMVLDVPQRGFRGYRFTRGDSDAAWRAFDAGEAVIVSEPYAYHHRLQPGDSVLLPVKGGTRRFPVAGVFKDYSSEHGVVVMNRKMLRQAGFDFLPATVGVYLAGSASKASVIAAVEELAARQSLLVRDKQVIHDASLQVFDRTFTVTQVLRLVTVIVAIVGVFSALLALHLERAREFAVLRATGLDKTQLKLLVGTESAVIGLVSGMLAIPLGLALAAFLIFEINRRSFGWSMAFHGDLSQLVVALFLALVSAVAAGLYPAMKIAAARPADALRYD
jgi:putative ABC transport system permease protein